MIPLVLALSLGYAPVPLPGTAAAAPAPILPRYPLLPSAAECERCCQRCGDELDAIADRLAGPLASGWQAQQLMWRKHEVEHLRNVAWACWWLQAPATPGELVPWEQELVELGADPALLQRGHDAR